MRKALFLFSVLALLLSSCDRYPNPTDEYLENDYFHFLQPANSKFFAGELVDDSITFNAISSLPNKHNSFRVDFDVVSGGGTITGKSFLTDSNGNTYTGWKLGTSSFRQKLRAKVYDNTGYYLSTAFLTVYGFRENEWDTCNFSPDGYINCFASDRTAGVSFMISGSQLYKQQGNYFTWKPVSNLAQNSFFEIDTDSNNIFYLTTWDGQILRSEDHGSTWNSCSKPYPEDPYYVYTTVANDNSIWAFKWNYPVRISSDGGKTWHNAGQAVFSTGYGDVCRLADGSIMLHGSDCCSLYRSTDNGATWYHIITPGLSTRLYSDGGNTFYIVTQENGITFYRSDDFGVSFKKIHNVHPDWGTTRRHKIIQHVNGTYWILVPGYGIVKSNDLVHFADYWQNSNLNDLFIDHNGVLIARDWNNNTVYYRKDSSTK